MSSMKYGQRKVPLKVVLKNFPDHQRWWNRKSSSWITGSISDCRCGFVVFPWQPMLLHAIF